MKFCIVFTLFITSSAFAVMKENPYQVRSLAIYQESEQGLVKIAQEDKIKSKVVKSKRKQTLKDLEPDLPGVGSSGSSDPIKDAGDIIGVAEKIVALGEKIYELVNKGRPTNEFNYAPISVIPKTDKGSAADILMDLSGGSMPMVENYHIVAKNGFDKTIVDFEFTLMFFHSLSYNGVGSYITAAQIIPKSVNVSWGFDFNATMKLNGIVNHGSSANPVAGAILVLEYDIKNAFNYSKKSAIFHIMGNGKVFTY